MRILALNCGSSSVKCAVIDGVARRRLLDVRVESIGTAACRAAIGEVEKPLGESTDLKAAVAFVLGEIRGQSATIEVVAHRVVHGGERFVQPTLIDDTSLEAIEALSPLAPLHNPP